MITSIMSKISLRFSFGAKLDDIFRILVEPANFESKYVRILHNRWNHCDMRIRKEEILTTRLSAVSHLFLAFFCHVFCLFSSMRLEKYGRCGGLILHVDSFEVPFYVLDSEHDRFALSGTVDEY